jgi:hypothetical protein
MFCYRNLVYRSLMNKKPISLFLKNFYFSYFGILSCRVYFGSFFFSFNNRQNFVFAFDKFVELLKPIASFHECFQFTFLINGKGLPINTENKDVFFSLDDNVSQYHYHQTWYDQNSQKRKNY